MSPLSFHTKRIFLPFILKAQCTSHALAPVGERRPVFAQISLGFRGPQWTNTKCAVHSRSTALHHMGFGFCVSRGGYAGRYFSNGVLRSVGTHNRLPWTVRWRRSVREGDITPSETI